MTPDVDGFEWSPQSIALAFRKCIVRTMGSACYLPKDTFDTVLSSIMTRLKSELESAKPVLDLLALPTGT